MLPLLEHSCCCVGGALTGEAEEDVSIHCIVVGVGAEGAGGGGGPREENMEGGAADDEGVEEEGALQPGEICSAFRTRSGCCRSLWGRITQHELCGS